MEKRALPGVLSPVAATPSPRGLLQPETVKRALTGCKDPVLDDVCKVYSGWPVCSPDRSDMVVEALTTKLRTPNGQRIDVGVEQFIHSQAVLAAARSPAAELHGP